MINKTIFLFCLFITPLTARADSFEQSLSDIRRTVINEPSVVLRLPISMVREVKDKAFAHKMLGRETIGISMGYDFGSSGMEYWGKFQVRNKRYSFLFEDLEKGIEKDGFLFQSIYENALILKVTRLSDKAHAQAEYMELMEMLFDKGLKVDLGGLEFALYVEGNAATTTSIYIIQDRSLGTDKAYRTHLRNGLRAGDRITWFFVELGVQYGVRPEGDNVVFYARPASFAGEEILPR